MFCTTPRFGWPMHHIYGICFVKYIVPLVCARRTASSRNSFVNRRCCVIEFLIVHRELSTFPKQVQSPRPRLRRYFPPCSAACAIRAPGGNWRVAENRMASTAPRLGRDGPLRFSRCHSGTRAPVLTAPPTAGFWAPKLSHSVAAGGMLAGRGDRAPIQRRHAKGGERSRGAAR